MVSSINQILPRFQTVLLLSGVIVLLFSNDRSRATVQASSFRAYRAKISPIPGTGSGVNGEVVVFITADAKRVAYAGHAMGVQANLTAQDCTATNGCGVHIHSGFSCFNSTLQEGHYFVHPVLDDPWTEDRYTSDENGVADFQGIVAVGTDDIDGRAFVVHAQDGSRFACGLLEDFTEESFSTATYPLTDARVVGEVTVLPGSTLGTGECFYGSARRLEPDLKSFLVDGDDCTAKNGCGAHIHSGTLCVDSTAQGGHYYADSLAEDPWAIVGYTSTTDEGYGEFVDCVATGQAIFDGQAFVVHANDGSRVSCGLFQPSCEVTLRLWDASKDEPIGPLVDGIDLCTHGQTKLSIEAVALCNDRMRLILFDKTGERLKSKLERFPPFMLNGNLKENIHPLPLLNQPGNYTITGKSRGKLVLEETSFMVGNFTC